MILVPDLSRVRLGVTVATAALAALRLRPRRARGGFSMPR